MPDGTDSYSDKPRVSRALQVERTRERFRAIGVRPEHCCRRRQDVRRCGELDGCTSKRVRGRVASRCCMLRSPGSV